MDFRELLSGFFARYAVEGLSADVGDATLSIDGTEVTFRADEENDTVVVTASIMEMPPDARGLFASLALQANYAAVGATALSLDAEGELAASTSLPLALADPDTLSGAVEALVNTAEEWRRNAVAFLDVDEEAALSDAENADANPLSGSSGFIRV